MKPSNLDYPEPDSENFSIKGSQGNLARRRRNVGSAKLAEPEELLDLLDSAEPAEPVEDDWLSGTRTPQTLLQVVLNETIVQAERRSVAGREFSKLEARWLYLKDSRDQIETKINLWLGSSSSNLQHSIYGGPSGNLWNCVQDLDKGPFQNPETDTYLGQTANKLFEFLSARIALISKPRNKDSLPADSVGVIFREDAAEVTIMQDPTIRWVIYYSDLCWPGINVRMYSQDDSDFGRLRVIGRSYMLATKLIDDTIDLLRKFEPSGGLHP